MNFKAWLSESVDLFPQPEDLVAFLNHAATVCIRTHQEMFKEAKSQRQKDLMQEIISLSELLQHMQQDVESRFKDAPPLYADTEYPGKSSPSLRANQYPHKFPTFQSVIHVLKTLGSHYFIEKPATQALSDQLDKVLRAWSLALQ